MESQLSPLQDSSWVSWHFLLRHGNRKNNRVKSWAGVSFSPRITQLFTKAKIKLKIFKLILFFPNCLVSWARLSALNLKVFQSRAYFILFLSSFATTTNILFSVCLEIKKYKNHHSPKSFLSKVITPLF